MRLVSLCQGAKAVPLGAFPHLAMLISRASTQEMEQLVPLLPT